MRSSALSPRHDLILPTSFNYLHKQSAVWSLSGWLGVCVADVKAVNKLMDWKQFGELNWT